MKKTILLILTILLSSTAQATLIDFEDFAAPGGLVNINPGSPYMEDGFTITPSNADSAVFDSAAGATMIGNDTDWYGFAENNLQTLTLTSGNGTFALMEMLIGPSNIGAGTVDMTVTGFLFGGGFVQMTFEDLVTATMAQFGWSNLISVEIRVTDDAALDNIRVPEPSALFLLAFGLVGLLRRRR